MLSLKKIFQKKKIAEKIVYNDVNFTNNTLFVHIPKNAGTSIAKGLGFNSTTHIKASEIKKKYGGSFIEDKFSFAIVRNPIDRFISLYNYARMDISYYHNNIEPEKSIYGKHLDYELLKNSSLLECAQYLKAGMLKHDLHWNHWEPQYRWIYDLNSNQKLIKKIYNFENLQELVQDMYSMFNYKFELIDLNKSKKEYNFENIDTETILILKEYYMKDFELFNYK